MSREPPMSTKENKWVFFGSIARFEGFMNKYLFRDCCPVVKLQFLEIFFNHKLTRSLFTVMVAEDLDFHRDFTEVLLQSGSVVTSEGGFNSASGLPWRLLNQSWKERGHFNTDIQLLLMRAVKCMDDKGIVDGTHFLWIEVPEIFDLQCGFYFGCSAFVT